MSAQTATAIATIIASTGATVAVVLHAVTYLITKGNSNGYRSN